MYGLEREKVWMKYIKEIKNKMYGIRSFRVTQQTYLTRKKVIPCDSAVESANTDLWVTICYISYFDHNFDSKTPLIEQYHNIFKLSSLLIVPSKDFG